MEKFFEEVWERVEHVVRDFICTVTIIGGLSLISAILHHTDLSKDRISLIESLHFWTSFILMTMFSATTIVALATQMIEDVKQLKPRGQDHDKSRNNGDVHTPLH